MLEAIQEWIEDNQEMEAAIRSTQEEMKTAINSILLELEETIRHQVEDILVSVNQQT
jgi:hypothetical protein